MKEKTAIEKMVDELEAELASHEDRYGRELTRHHIERARRLASLEAKEAEHKCQYGKTFYGDNTEQLVLSVVEWLKKVSPSSLEAKPTANADIVELPCPTCGAERFKTERRPNGDSWCRYGHKHPTKDFVRPVVKGQGEAGLRVNCVNRTNCTLNSQTRICKEKFGIDSCPCPDDADANCTVPVTPVPVASGLSTSDLIAELEKRRHELCPKCANGKSVLCVECVWAGVYRAYRKDDNFKDKK